MTSVHLVREQMVWTEIHPARRSDVTGWLGYSVWEGSIRKSSVIHWKKNMAQKKTWLCKSVVDRMR